MKCFTNIIMNELNHCFRREAEGTDERLTTTGEDAIIFNGVPDWVFEEEVFEEAKALWWAPNGKALVRI